MEFISQGRLPIEARSSIDAATQFLTWIESEFEKSQVLNPDIYTLASWANYPLYNDSGLSADHLVVESVESIGLEQTYDFSIPEHHNYIANTAVCHNTTNLPADVDVKTVKDIYMMGWELGCKGITVYRDGSRSGVLVATDNNEKTDQAKIIERHAPKRPEVLECDIHHTSIRGQKWVVLVGLIDSKPYEVIGGEAAQIEIPRKYKKALLSKRVFKTQNSKYDLTLGKDDDLLTIKNVVDVFNNPNHAGYTRVISTSLRHGVPVQFLVEQMQKDKESDLFSFSKVISRCLKNYIIDGTVSSDKICDVCRSEDALIYQEGCVTCASCGQSKCS